MIYKHSTVYDTWRHVFFVYPFWIIMGAMGWAELGEWINARLGNKERAVKQRPIWQAIAIIGLLPAIIWTVRSHPNQTVYFNELVGGAKGAYGNYDLDYYQNSGLQAVEWLKKNVKPTPGRKIVVRSNMSGFYNYFLTDTAWIDANYTRYNDRHSKDWDYYIANPRFLPLEQLQNNKWQLQNTVHTVSVDGVPLCIVVQRKNKDGIAAGKALEAKDFPTAVRLYESYLQTDTTDEFAYVNYGIAQASAGQLDPAIAAIQHAIRLQPGNAQFYDLLAQLYNAKGDAANAQQAHNKAQTITAEEQEAMGEEE